MMNVFAKNKLVIILVVLVVVCLASLVNASMNLKRSSKGFHDEMAQRLDLEEKVIKLEKGRDASQTELTGLKEQLTKNKEEIDSLKNALTASDNEKASLKSELEKTKGQAVVQK